METAALASATVRTRQAFYLIALVLAFATLVQVAFAWRQGMGGDQRRILSLGSQYADTGQLDPSAKQTSGGGRVPGVLFQYVVGKCLVIWPDRRAPALLLVLLNAASLLLIAQTMWRLAGPRSAMLMVALYGLSPWRLYYGSLLWEPAFLFLPAALHFAASAALRDKARVVPSLILGAVVVLAFQFHASFMVLAVATLILAYRGVIQSHWPAVAVGGVLAGLPFILTSLSQNGDATAFIPHHDGNFLSHVAMALGNIPKVLAYWFRMGSAAVARRLVGDSTPSSIAGPITLLAFATTAIPVAACVQSWRRLRPWTRFPQDRATVVASTPGNGVLREFRVCWLERYAFAMLVSVIVCAALSPVWVQSWHVVVALIAACLTPAMFLENHWSKGRRTGRLIVRGFLALVVASSLLILLRHPFFAV